jgi:hypothetical protein
MLNNKATQAKLESMTNKVTQTKLVTQELLLCYIRKKVTSKLHKLTNYKRNYTSELYEM